MAKKDPIPIIGVRGSDYAVSAPKAVLLGSAVVVATTTLPGEALSPVDRLITKTGGGTGFQAALDNVKRSVSRSWNAGNGKLVAIGLGAMALFGKKIDKSVKLPVKFGK